MDRLPSVRAVTRRLAQHRDTREMREVISDALVATPSEDRTFRDGIWSYVRGHLQSPGAAPLEPQTVRTGR